MTESQEDILLAKELIDQVLTGRIGAVGSVSAGGCTIELRPPPSWSSKNYLTIVVVDGGWTKADAVSLCDRWAYGGDEPTRYKIVTWREELLRRLVATIAECRQLARHETLKALSQLGECRV